MLQQVRAISISSNFAHWGGVLLLLLAAGIAPITAFAGPPPYDTRMMGPGPGPHLGVMSKELSFHRLDELGVDYGVEVVDVKPGGAADRAGIRPRDVILTLHGKPVFSIPRLRWLVVEAARAGKTEIGLLRAGNRMKIDVELYAPKSPRALRGQEGYLPSDTRSFLGVGTQSLTADLREAFGVPAGAGVLVSSVVPDSAAAKAGLKAGDVIVKLAGKEVASVADIRRTLASYRAGERVALELIRNRDTQTVELELGAAPDGEEQSDAWSGSPESYGFWPGFPPPEVWRHGVDEMLKHWHDLMKRYNEGGCEDRYGGCPRSGEL